MRNALAALTAVLLFLGSVFFFTDTGERFVRERMRADLSWQELSASLIREKKERRKAGHVVSKFDRPDMFQEYHWAIRTRSSEQSPAYAPNHKIRALDKARSDPRYALKRAARPGSIVWQERGPANVPGRTRGLVALPDDPARNTWIAGAVGGGIWKTTDGGNSWSNRTPGLPTLAISWIDYCAGSPQVLYAATGEANGAGRGIIGSGVFKSTDAGETWQQLESTADDRAFTFINRVVVSPDDPDVVLICTSQGEWERDDRSEIYRSNDGGMTWQRVHASSRWIFQIVANPLNFNTLYAALWGRGVLKSTDGGRSWLDASDGFNNVLGRVELAVAPTDTSRLYALAVGNHSLNNPDAPGADLYVSYDAGANWAWVDQQYDGQRVDYLGGQGNYDNTIAVNPYDADEVYYGGVSLWKSVVSASDEETSAIAIDLFAQKGSTSPWEFINFGGTYAGGTLETGPKIQQDQLVDVEIRTGPGIGQLAHRFIVNKRGSGVPDSGYFYRDYVEVPFEVWDTQNNRQLMVSFRDQQEDGAFNLRSFNTTAGDEANHSREYIFVHNVSYDAQPHPEIAADGGTASGHTYRQMYFFWPVLRDRFVWTPEEPEVVIIDQEVQVLRKSDGVLQPVSDAYGDYVQLNPAYGPGSGFYFHPDHHNLIMLPVDSAARTFRILNANDGGVYISNTGVTPGTRDGDWENVGLGYNTGQFYSATKKPGADQYIGGLQDNGTWLSPGDVSPDAATLYRSVLGGDGFDVWWHHTDPDRILISIYNNRFYRTDNGGATWRRSDSGLSGEKPFFSKLASSDAQPDVVYTVSSLGVHRSDNFGQTWDLTPINSSWNFSHFMDVKVSRANADIVWAGSGMDGSHFVHVSTDGGRSFDRVVNYAGAELGILSGMATHPVEDSTAYVLFSFAGGPKILRTRDLGKTWEDISGFHSANTSGNGFPDVAVYALLALPDHPNTLWAGTEIGIFESVDNGASWTFMDSGLGSAAVWDMQWVDDQVVVATHGRGIFTASVDPLAILLEPPVISNAAIAPDGTLRIDAILPDLYDSLTVALKDIDTVALYPGSIGGAVLAVEGVFSGDSVDMQLTGYYRGVGFASEPFKVFAFNPRLPAASYVQDFNGGSEDFFGNGFGIELVGGFQDVALHSVHPYPEGANLLYQLKIPVVISEEDAVLSYRDVALMEEAAPGAAFNTPGFKDYVVVEASRDGLQWIPLGQGYDASLHGSWSRALSGAEDGSSALFKRREVDLLEHLNTGDTVFFRFRLYSDEQNTGWGWAIDDLRIQDVITGVAEDFPEDFSWTLYPNPASGRVTVSFSLAEPADMQIVILDLAGATVRNVRCGLLGEGAHDVDVDIGALGGGMYILHVQGDGVDRTEKLLIR